MIRKCIAIAVAVLINVAVLGWFHAWSTGAVASAAVKPASAAPVVTLPVITVRPSPAQLRELRLMRAPAGSKQANAAAGPACLVRPYYAFADVCGAAARG
ncbi:MAG TPA: hypothetical protein VF284_10130 [Rhodanobacteraceae bacterium]